MSLDDDARAELSELEASHRLRVPRVVEGAQGPVVVVDGTEVVNFASNDYLGLAGDPRLARAAASSLETDGLGAGASRLIVGNHREHVALEAALGDWLQRPGVRLFNTGYAANVGVLTALLRAGDVVISDQLNHASIIDGCRLSRAQVVVVPHRDVGAIERELGRCAGRRRIVVSESLFSMDGDLADVAAIATVCRRHEAAFVLDEAHAFGVLGPEGRGVAAAHGVVPDLVIGTLGKAVGTFGAFAATTRAIADLLWNRSRPFVFSTGMPPSIAAASSASIAIVRGTEGDARRAQLRSLAAQLRSSCARVGGDAGSPIAPVVLGDDRATMAASRQLFGRGMFVQGIRPPTVPDGTARLRISLIAEHSATQIAALASALQEHL